MLSRAASILALLLASPVAVGAASQAASDSLTVRVGTAVARSGETAYGVVRVAAGVDEGTEIPVVVVHGADPGPTLALIAGLHGMEYAGIVALSGMAAQLSPSTLRGTVIVVPLVNLAAFERKVPHLNPVDGKNLNRVFPGSSRGTQSERIAQALMEQVIRRSDYLIDLHGGDVDESLRPYAYWNVTGRSAQDSVVRELLLAFGNEYLIRLAGVERSPAGSRFMQTVAGMLGKPSFVADAGGAGMAEPADVTRLRDGCLNVMGRLGMIERAVAPLAAPVWVDSLVFVTSAATGIFRPAVERGTYVRRGMTLGEVHDYTGRPLQLVTAPVSGVVLFVAALPSMVKGDNVAELGVLRAEP